ncbi:MAG: DUF3089 domain-containing protein [Alphaproteobacteria bacterium]
MRRVQLAGAAAICALFVALAAACGGPKAATETAVAEPAPAADGAEAAVKSVAPVDYADKANWLCRPEAQDACKADISATVVEADGRLSHEAFTPDPKAPIDCFYVYPTASLDPTPNSDMTPGPEEAAMVAQQLIRFGSTCRLYAPVYRQVTLPAMRQMLDGKSPATNREMAYADIKAAWTHYLANDNAGRGVVLIGHDQGAGLLIRLIANEIDGKPAQDKLVSAILLGVNLDVPQGGTIGGAFKHVPLCVSNEDIGCAIAFSSFRADTPPPAESVFGRSTEQGMEAACVNPAMLDGSNGALKAYLPSARVTDSGVDPLPWTTAAPTILTPFVTVPGLLSARCVSEVGFSYLAITINGDPTDARTDNIGGDLMIDGKVQPAWGMHLYDVNLAIGNLAAVVKSQAHAYASREISRAQHPQDDK